jgi:acetyl-CoA C-acetyltransferase
MTTEAFIFDAVRTPRGRGKASGSLYEVKPVTLLSQMLSALQQRNGFETHSVDDIVIGCVTAIGDQGADIAKTAALVAGWDDDVAGVTLNRFCASGLEAVNGCNENSFWLGASGRGWRCRVDVQSAYGK